MAARSGTLARRPARGTPDHDDGVVTNLDGLDVPRRTGEESLIVLLIVAVVSGVALFLTLLPYGLIVAIVGASLGGSLLTAACAVAVAIWKTKRQHARSAKVSLSPEPTSSPLRRVNTP